MPGTPRQTGALAAIKGDLKQYPARYAQRFAKSDIPLGKPPDYLSATERAAWFEIASYAIEGTIRAPQRITMEMTCILISEMRSSPSTFPINKFSVLRMLLSDLCLTTSAQQKLRVEKLPDDSPYAAYID